MSDRFTEHQRKFQREWAQKRRQEWLAVEVFEQVEEGEEGKERVN